MTASKNIKIGIVIESNYSLVYFGFFAQKLVENNFQVCFFASSQTEVKQVYSPYLHQEHLLKYLREIKYDRELIWYKDAEELSRKLDLEKPKIVFAVEALPFTLKPELFEDRPYRIWNIPHQVDNFHVRAVKKGAIDKSVAPFEKYGEYLGWQKGDFVVLGNPKYDNVSFLSAKATRDKYQLPQNYILLLVPNVNLINPLIVYRIIKKIKRDSYEVVLKAKYPKCHHPVYKLMSKYYFLNDASFYPYITHELICASSGVVGFDSTAVEEALMYSKPLVNFSIKPYREKETMAGGFKQYLPLWKSEFCLDIDFKKQNIVNVFKRIPDFTSHFKKKIDYEKIQREKFFVPGNSADRIINYIKNELNL